MASRRAFQIVPGFCQRYIQALFARFDPSKGVLEGDGRFSRSRVPLHKIKSSADNSANQNIIETPDAGGNALETIVAFCHEALLRERWIVRFSESAQIKNRAKSRSGKCGKRHSGRE